MKNRTVLVFETLLKAKDIVTRSQPSFYPKGTYWLMGFSGGTKILELERGDRLENIKTEVFGQPDLILVKDAVLSPDEWTILAAVLGGNALYVICHYSSVDVNTKNTSALQVHEVLRPLLQSSITQSHLDGDFYYEELVRLLEWVESKHPNKEEGYKQQLRQLIDKRFPDPTLEAKLDLLHLCLVWDFAVTADLPAALNGEYTAEFREFQQGLTRENLAERLTRLRDRLLPG